MSFFFGKKKSAAPETPPPSEGSFLSGDAQSDERNVKILLDTIAAVNISVDLDELLVSIVDKTVEFTRTERGILLLADEKDALKVRVARDAIKRTLTADTQFSRTIPAKVYASREEIKQVVTSDEEARQLGTSVLELKLRSVMCAPLLVEERCIGAIYVDSKATAREFTASDLSLFNALAQQMAVAIERARLVQSELEKERMERDLNHAKSIQSYFYPEQIPDLKGFDIAAASKSADETTGDYYDFVEKDDGCLGVAVGDVSGHGIGAALILSKAQALLQTYVEVLDDLDIVFAKLNQKLSKDIEDGKFITVFFGILDPEAKALSYNNAGHSPPMVRRASTGKIETLDRTGIAIGLMPDSSYSMREGVALGKGDIVLFYTDGITESMDAQGEQFGEEGLMKVLEERAEDSAQAIVEEIFTRVRNHSEGVEDEGSCDDMTIIVIRVTE